MQNASFKLSDGSFAAVGHRVVNFNTLAVIVGIHTDANGEQSPILKQLVCEKLKGGKWVANPNLCKAA